MLLEGDERIDTLHLDVRDCAIRFEGISQVLTRALSCDLGDVDLPESLAVIFLTIILVTMTAAAL